jgi:hypothetical protein
MAALSRYLSMGSNRSQTLKTSPEIASWIVSLPLYIFFINKQSSHLNTWPKANGIHELLGSYVDSINPLFFTIPFILALFLNPPLKKEYFIEPENNTNKFLLLSSILWISIPAFVWLLSYLTPLNLFKDRYFIPKESGWMILTAMVMARLPFNRSNSSKTLFPAGACILLGVGILSLSTKRQLFSINRSQLLPLVNR